MRITLASPLFPPEIAEPAPYTKELATRLAGGHQVSVVAYAHSPERVQGAEIISVEKRRPLPIRLIRFYFALFRAARGTDILYIQNGPSVELPAAFFSLFTRTPLIIHIGDTAAHTYAQTRPLLRAIERFVRARARKVVTDSPLARPEINPLLPQPEAELAAYEASWAKHLAYLEDLFSNAKN